MAFQVKGKTDSHDQIQGRSHPGGPKDSAGGFTPALGFYSL